MSMINDLHNHTRSGIIKLDSILILIYENFLINVFLKDHEGKVI